MPEIPSIFDEQDLINKLLEIVDPKIKQAQTNPTDPAKDLAANNAIKSLAKKLTDRLSASSGITMDKPDAALYMRDLDSFDSLISFLNINGVKFAEKFIVQPDYNKLTPEERKSYLPFKWSGGVDAMPMGSTVAIYRDGLVGYLKSLQQKASADGTAKGKLLSTRISQLIENANTVLKANIDPEAMKDSATTDAQPVLSDSTPLDSVNETLVVENALSPGRAQGTINITPKDLKSKMAFDEFAHKIKVSKGGKVYDYEQVTSESFFCDILNVLHARAASYAYRRGVYLDQAYLKLVTDLAGQYKCNLTVQPGTQTATAPTAGGLPGLTGPVLIELASLRPFNSNSISFPNINLFLEKYSSLDRNPGVLNTVNAIGQYMRNIDSMFAVPQDTIQMNNLTTDEFKGWLKKPSEAQLAAGNLYDIIHYAGTLYQRMLDYLQTIGRDPKQLDPSLFRAMQQQVTPGGPQATNIADLNQLRAALQREWNKR
jgi:hypothetical protein